MITKPNIERDESIKKDYLNGLTWREIGKKYNMSRQRAHQIVKYKNTITDTIKDEIKKRDNWTCQWGEKCDPRRHPPGLGTILCVHHIDSNPQNNNADNLITLCNKCHLDFHHKVRE